MLQASLLCLELQETLKSHQLLKIVAPLYKMALKDCAQVSRIDSKKSIIDEKIDVKDEKKVDKESIDPYRAFRGFANIVSQLREKGISDLNWIELHVAILGSIVEIPGYSQKTNANDTALLGMCYGYLLGNCSPYFDPNLQSFLLKKIELLNRFVQINVENLVQVVQIEPLSVSEELLPKARQAEGKENVFVYAPDAKNNRGSNKSSEPEKISAVVDEPLDIRLRVLNNLNIPVTITSVQFIASQEFVCFPANFVIPAARQSSSKEFSVTVSGVPKANVDNVLSIKGVRLGLVNTYADHMVDEMGFGGVRLSCLESNPRGLEHGTRIVDVRNISLAPKQPRATLRVLQENGLSEYQPTKLLFTQKAKIWIEISNIGDLDINALKLKIDMVFSVESKEAQALYYGKSKKAASDGETSNSMVSWDEKKLKACIPLKPKEALKVPVNINAHPSCHGIDLEISYSHDEKSSFQRTFKSHARWTVFKGLKVLDAHSSSPQKARDTVNLILTLQNSCPADILLHHCQCITNLQYGKDAKEVEGKKITVRKHSVMTVIFKADKQSFGVENDLALIRHAHSGSSDLKVVRSCVQQFLEQHTIEWHVESELSEYFGSGELPLEHLSNRLINNSLFIRNICKDPVRIDVDIESHDKSIDVTREESFFVMRTEQFVDVSLKVIANDPNIHEVLKSNKWQVELVPDVPYQDNKQRENDADSQLKDILLNVGSLKMVKKQSKWEEFTLKTRLCFLQSGTFHLNGFCRAWESKHNSYLQVACLAVRLLVVDA